MAVRCVLTKQFGVCQKNYLVYILYGSSVHRKLAAVRWIFFASVQTQEAVSSEEKNSKKRTWVIHHFFFGKFAEPKDRSSESRKKGVKINDNTKKTTVIFFVRRVNVRNK